MQPELDTFDSPAEPMGSELESFDNDDYDYSPDKTEEEEDEAPVAKKASKDEVDPDSQVNNLDEKEDVVEVKKQVVAKTEASVAPVKEETDIEPTGKAVKAIFGDKQMEIPEEATVRVRIDGKAQRVPVRELINNYSGKVAYEEKFNKLGEEKKSFDRTYKVFESEKAEVISDIQNILTRVEGVYSGKNTPSDAIEFILDKLGFDAFKYKQAVMEHYAEEFINLAEMDETERQLYWQKMQNEHLIKSQETLKNQSEDTRIRKERESSLKTLRETHGVSEEEFASARSELSETYKDLTEEQIVRYAAMKPFTIQAEELMDEYRDQLDTTEFNEAIVTISKNMFQDRNLTPEMVAEILEEQYALDEYVSKVNKKHPKKQEAKAESKASNASKAYEDWDDFDD